MDPALERKAQQWKAAKDRKDYRTADRLRADLRAAGFDPDEPRHGGRNRGDNTEFQLQQWQAAKAAKDYATADAIREELRAKGIEPDPLKKSSAGHGPKFQDGYMPGFVAPFRAPVWQPPPMMAMPMTRGSTRPYDADVENELDQWESAKNEKDFETADAIRAGLRNRGISPSKERSKNPSTQEQVMQWQRAKKAKDYERSDRIREALRSQGCDPSKMLDQMGGGGLYGMGMPIMPTVPMIMPSWRSAEPAKKRNPSLSKMDGGTLDELAKWHEAKDEKNWAVADSIRERLRRKGIEPANCQRPGSGGLDASMEEELAQWFEAKDAKDYATADAIRERLRAQGVEPAQCARPAAGGFGKAPKSGGGARSSPYGSAAFDGSTEDMLDMWWKSKQDKDYAEADRIRAELRAQGIEPDHHRPRR